MKLSPEQKERIKLKFNSIQATQEFAELLEWIFKQKYPKTESLLISVDDLEFFAQNHPQRYVQFTIPKKSGGTRTITAPCRKLKIIQKLINEVLNAVYTPHFTATGFVPQKSIIDNADLHINKRFVYNIDLKDFFPSVPFGRIRTVLRYSPFKLHSSSNSNNIIGRGAVGLLITKLCCENGSLPQGAPTSPTLTNIVCYNLDKQLFRLAKQHFAIYSRYADDITFSSNRPVFNEEFRKKLIEIIETREKFTINFAKERLQTSKKQQSVTGIVVNVKRNIDKTYKKDIRFCLMCWEKFGIVATRKKILATRVMYNNEFYSNNYFARYLFGRIYNNNYIARYLFGRILYVGLVRGINDTIYQKFITKFVQLNEKSSNLLHPKYYKNISSVPLLSDDTQSEVELRKLFNVLNVWEQEGIEKAQTLSL